MVIIYDLIFLVYAIVTLPVLLLKGKWHESFAQRFGSFSAALLARLREKRNLWIHAVSVGEVQAVGGLIKELKKAYPQYQLVLTTVTKTGFELAQQNFAQECLVLYAPVDLSWSVRRFVRNVSPTVYLVAETEIWPNLWLALGKDRIPIVQVNGRISDQAFGRYERIKWLLAPIINKAHLFCMQSERDVKRLVALGALPQKVHLAGNIKFDDVADSVGFHPQDYGLLPEEPVWIAGSTHPGEEEIILSVYAQLRAAHPRLRLILAPRHPHRVKEVCHLVESQNFGVRLFSTLSTTRVQADEVIVVDTIGQLRSLYSLATVVFVGKSLRVGGGHNIIEPAFWSKPIVVGPAMQNFQDILDIFLQHQAIRQVADAKDLMKNVSELLANSAERERLGASAKDAIRQYQGATRRIVMALSALVK